MCTILYCMAAVLYMICTVSTVTALYRGGPYYSAVSAVSGCTVLHSYLTICLCASLIRYTNWKLESLHCSSTLCYNFLPFSCLLSSYCSMTSLLLLCPVTYRDQSLLTHLPALLFLLDLPSLVSYLVTGLSLPLTISLTIATFPWYSTLFYDPPLR